MFEFPFESQFNIRSRNKNLNLICLNSFVQLMPAFPPFRENSATFSGLNLGPNLEERRTFSPQQFQ